MGKKLRYLVLGLGWWLYGSLGYFCYAHEDAKLDLEKIIVTPSRYEQAYRSSCANINVIDAEEIVNSGTSEVSKVLDILPSLDVLDYGYFCATKLVHIRGTSSNNAITLVNGRLVNTPRDGVADLNYIPLNNIERIEVLKGPASAVYGANAVGGVINIITKSGKERMSTELYTKLGSFGTYDLGFSHGWKIGQFGYFISTSYIESNGYRENSDSKQSSYNLKIDWDANNTNNVTFETGYTELETGAPGRNNNVDMDDREEKWMDYIDFTWAGSCWRDSKVLLKLYQHLDRLEFIETPPPTLIKDVHHTKVYGIDFQLSQVWFDLFRITFGTSAQENKLNSSTTAKHSYNFKAAYTETELALLDNDLVLKGGARIDDYSNFGNKTSPSASFSWWLLDKFKAHGLIAKSFRSPTFNDLYWPREDWGMWGGVEGNPSLMPETALSKEIGLSTLLFNNIESDITYFYTDFKDMINWTMDDAFWWRPTNVGTATISGVETNLNYQFSKSLKANINYTRLSAIDENTKKWLSYRPRHQYKGTINYNHEKFDCYITAKYQTKRYTNAENSRFLKSYFIANANFEYAITKFTNVTLAINNIFDRDYEEEEGYPMPGTSVMAGIKIKF
ncbi:MAG: TonB-dependent receptor [Candidatus Omnitrophica bacterium]|nr:TonB-dependent receptor [Candidatus Omnitrophota bacterium]